MKVGIVKKYSIEKGSGFIEISKWQTAFFSHRNVIREEGSVGTLKLHGGEFVTFNLSMNDRGYIAEDVKLISEETYNKAVLENADNKFNK